MQMHQYKSEPLPLRYDAGHHCTYANALAAVVCLLFMLDTAENTINERTNGLSINGWIILR